ncbi:hypothetical protein FRC12_015917 [Ceratobasidium sp. 428]|nr:hypothetical protein FRC12_015917 [Ceratobasidium sp. 428]
MTSNQHKFCCSTVRTLKRLKDAALFLRPVDPMALNIPHYPLIIKRLMDFATIETRLQNSNPSKAPSDPLAARYHTYNDFVANMSMPLSPSPIAPPAPGAFNNIDDVDGWQDMPIIRAGDNPFGLDEEDVKRYRYVEPKIELNDDHTGNATGNTIDFNDRGTEWRPKLDQDEED